MKKKGLFVLLLVGLCLLTVACGKDKKEDKKEETNVKTLKCSVKEDDESLEMELAVDTKAKKLTKATMTYVLSADAYEGLYDDEKELEEKLCDSEDEEYKSCEVKVKDGKVTVNMEFDTEDYAEELEDEYDIKEWNEDALKTLKDDVKDGGYTCTIS